MDYSPVRHGCDGREITTPVSPCQQKSATDVSPLTFADRFQQVFPGLSVAEIARKLEVPHATARNYKRGRIPATEILIRLASETDVSLNWLLTGEGPQSVNPRPTTGEGSSKTLSEENGSSKPHAQTERPELSKGYEERERLRDAQMQLIIEQNHRIIKLLERMVGQE